MITRVSLVRIEIENNGSRSRVRFLDDVTHQILAEGVSENSLRDAADRAVANLRRLVVAVSESLRALGLGE